MEGKCLIKMWLPAALFATATRYHTHYKCISTATDMSVMLLWWTQHSARILYEAACSLGKLLLFSCSEKRQQWTMALSQMILIPSPFSNKCQHLFTWDGISPFGQFLKKQGLNTFMMCSSHYAKSTLYKTLMIRCVSVCACVCDDRSLCPFDPLFPNASVFCS